MCNLSGTTALFLFVDKVRSFYVTTNDYIKKSQDVL